MKRVLIAVAVLALLIAGAAWLLRKPLTLRAIDRVVAANMASSLIAELPDGLHVALCGAGSPLPDPERSGPCVAVIAGGRLFLVDTGSGSSRVLSRLRIPQRDIEGILLTHFHSDHIDGLGEVLLQRWAGSGATQPTPVHGPPGVERVVQGFGTAYAADDGYRVAHHGPRVMPPGGAGAVARPFRAPAPGEGVVIVDDGGLVVTAFRVNHDPIDPAVGYRFDYGGRSALVSGDTKRSANLERFADGVDLLVHEALDPELVARLTQAAESAGRDRLAAITRDILTYHTTPEEAAAVAQAAGADRLLFYHIVPPLPLGPMREIFVEGVERAYGGPFGIGRDGTLVVMERDGEGIAVRELL